MKDVYEHKIKGMKTDHEGKIMHYGSKKTMIFYSFINEIRYICKFNCLG